MTRRFVALFSLLALSLVSAPAPAGEALTLEDRASIERGERDLAEMRSLTLAALASDYAIPALGSAPILASGNLETVAVIEVQDTTEDLDASTIVLLPNKNRKKFFLLAHPDNTDAVWVRLVPETVSFKRSAAVGDASANATTVANAADATDENSGIYLGSAGSSFGEDASGGIIWRGAVTAVGAAAGQKLVVLAIGGAP